MIKNMNPFNPNNFGRHTIPKPAPNTYKGKTTVNMGFALGVNVNRQPEKVETSGDVDRVAYIILDALQECDLFDDLLTFDYKGCKALNDDSSMRIYIVGYSYETGYKSSREEWGWETEYDEYVTSDLICQYIRDYVKEHGYTDLIGTIKGGCEKEFK